MVNYGMFTKWRIKNLEQYVVAENGEIFRRPTTINQRSYAWRLIKQQHPERWRLNKEWWSKKQLRPLLYLDPEPEKIFLTKETPW